MSGLILELLGSLGARLGSFQWEGRASWLSIFFGGGEARPVMEAGYRILVTYSDILGNRYLQFSQWLLMGRMMFSNAR